MITCIQVNNPFKPSDRHIKRVEPTGENIKPYFTLAADLDMVFSRNGKIIEDPESFIPEDGDFLAACPVVHGGGGGGGGKNALQIVGMLALTVVSFGAAGLVGGMGTIAGTLTAGAVMYLGGTLLSPMNKNPKVDIPNIANSSWENGHSWDKMQALAVQGGAVPITYGKIRTAGQIISQHVTSDGSKQFLNLLLCGGEGEIDAITNIKINDNPIANFTDVIYETRLGTNTQSAIQFFGDSFADQYLNYELSEDAWSNHTTEGDAGTGLEISFSAPQGLYSVDAAGSIVRETVQLDIEYRIEGGTWAPFLGMAEVIGGDGTKAIRKIWTLNNLAIGRYEVRAKVNTRNSGARFFTQIFWSQLSHIVADDFARPGKILLGIRALATDKLSGGMPSITWEQTRNTVLVWNPTGGEGSGAYEEKSATNPAWICYDLIHACRLLTLATGSGSQYVVYGDPADMIDYSAFSAWATWCDFIVDETNNDKRCELNLLIDAPTDLWEAVQKVASSGRGMILLKGSQYSCVFDGTSSPVQLFCVGNTIKDSFSGDFLPLKDRADAVEISFINEQKNYQKDVVIVYSETYDTAAKVKNPTQIFLTGITNPRRAYREGIYRLKLNNIVRTCTWRADIDSIAAQIGDVVRLQSDVTLWGDGGRLAAATIGQVTLDKYVTMEPGSAYSVLVRFGDDTIETKAVTAVLVTTTTNVLNLTTNFTQIPQKFDIWSFGETGIETKPFKLISVVRDGDLRAQLSGIEYIPEVYDETATVPSIDYTSTLPTITDLVLKAYYGRDGNGMIQIAWTPPRKSYGGAIVIIDGVQVARLDWHSVSFDFPISQLGTYTITVLGLDAVGAISGSLEDTLVVALTPPAQVYNFQAYQDGDTVDLSWDANAEADVVGYEIREGPDSWDTALVIIGALAATGWSSTVGSERVYRFMIRAINKNGLMSEVPAEATVLVSNLLPANVVVEYDELLLQTGARIACAFTDVGGRWMDIVGTWNDYPATRWLDVPISRLEFTGMVE